jgi:hypothetical protein
VLKEVGYKGVNWIHQTEHSDEWRVLVTAAGLVNFLLPQRLKDFAVS